MANDKNVVTCYDEINRFLSDYPYVRNNGGAIFIHESVLTKFRDRIRNYGGDITDENAWYYDLRIGAKRYRMYLVWPNHDVMVQSKLHAIIRESKYSFPWDLNTSIYTTIDKFHLVEKFIEDNKLGYLVRNYYTDTNRLCIEADIKVAEFITEISRDLLSAFRVILEMNNYTLPNSYFATRAFKYLRPSYLAYINKLNNHLDMNTPVLSILDFHQGQSENGNDIFNLFDLISFKMANDDNRLEYENCEFHKLIRAKLKDMSGNDKKSYINIKKKHFHLNKYHSDLGILGYSEEVYQYLVTQYHSHFDQLKVFEKYGTFKIKPNRIKNIDSLLSSSRYYKKLNVDVTSLEKHNADVLMKIFTYSDLQFRPTISFDTEKALTLPRDFNHDTIDNFNILPGRDLHFKGKNENHFIENLLKWMRVTMGSRWDNTDLRFIDTKIQDPSVLTGLTVRMIVIKNVQITCELLRALHHVKYEIIKFSKCNLENDSDIFMLLDGLGGDRYIQINIENHTLNILMDSILKMLTTTGRREFQFQNYITIYYLESKFEFIDLSRFKFYVNDEGIIETLDLITNETVYLYEYFYLPSKRPYDTN